MRHTTLDIAAEFGEYPSSRPSARRARERILGLLDGEFDVVELDFGGVEVFSNSFGDGVVAVLIAQRGMEWFAAHIELSGLELDDIAELNKSISRRLDEPVAIRAAVEVA